MSDFLMSDILRHFKLGTKYLIFINQPAVKPLVFEALKFNFFKFYKMKKIVVFLLAFIAFTMFATTTFAQVIEGTYAIKNVQTGMLLRIKDANKTNGTPLVAYSPVNWKCVTWDFKHLDGETYQLRNLFTNKTFQSKSGVAAEGVMLEQQPLVMLQASQQYDFIVVEKNVYLIRAKGTELYVTPVDKNGAIDSGIMLAKKGKGKLQQWTIYEQKPTM